MEWLKDKKNRWVVSIFAAMAAAVPLPSCLRYSRQNFSCAGLSFSDVVFLPAFGVVFLPEFLTVAEIF